MSTTNTSGRRKTAIARIYLTAGSGNITVNGKDYKTYFPTLPLQYIITQSTEVAGVAGNFDVQVNVAGGGVKGQAEAVRLATTQQMSFADLFAGRRGLSKPPIDDIDTYWSGREKAQAMHMLKHSIFGSVDTVRTGLQAFIAETGVDEVMIVSDVYEHQARLRSLELIAESIQT